MSFRIFWRLNLVLLLFYTLQRGLFWFWNRDYYLDSAWTDILAAFVYGVRFDLVAISWILVLTLIWGWVVRRGTWLIPTFLSLGFYILSIIDNELNKFWARRLTFSVMKLFKEADGKVAGMAGENVFWILLGLGLSIPFLYQIYRLFRFELRYEVRGISYWLKQSSYVLLLVIMSRGGFQKKPVSLIHSQIFEQPELNLLVLNTSFSVVKSLSKKAGVERVNYMPQAEALERANLYQKSEIKPSPIKSSERPNLVLIILESFSSEYTRLNLNLKNEYTPFFNSLMLRGFVFPNTFANGRRSIEGVASILAGIPVLMEEPFINSEYSGLKISGIGEAFHERGYDTSFYHGGENGTMNFDSFSKKIGIRNYYGFNEYPQKEDFDGVWGVWDRPYLQYYANELSKKSQPFFSTVFTLSSHHPYRVPQNESHKFREKNEHPILKSLEYTDSALEDFFFHAQKQSWYDNTIFILVADHVGPIVFENSKDPLSSYKIPLVFFSPMKIDWNQIFDNRELSQQADIPPTIYDLFNLKGTKTTLFGRSLLQKGPRIFSTWSNGTTLHTNGEQVLVMGGEKIKASSFGNWPSHVEVDENLLKDSQAQIQNFAESLWSNQLYR